MALCGLCCGFATQTARKVFTTKPVAVFLVHEQESTIVKNVRLTSPEKKEERRTYARSTASHSLARHPPPLLTFSTHRAARLRLQLGLFDLLMIGIGATVGSGVFVLTGQIALCDAGSATALSWIVAGVACMLSGFSYMELSALVPSHGSTYAYSYHALGELPAYIAGFLLTLECV